MEQKKTGNVTGTFQGTGTAIVDAFVSGLRKLERGQQ
jgi:hypothetical protein